MGKPKKFLHIGFLIALFLSAFSIHSFSQVVTPINVIDTIPKVKADDPEKPENIVIEPSDSITRRNIPNYASDTTKKINPNAYNPNFNNNSQIIPQDSIRNRPPVQNGLVIFFTREEVIFKKGEIVSNVLCVINETDKEVSFVADISAPSTWQPFNKKSKIWVLAPKDSIFIPVRIVPKSGFTGSSRYMFSAFLYTPDEDFIGYNKFTAFTEKQLKWDLNTSDNKIYLLNNDNHKNFNVSILNTGPEIQTIQMQVMGLSSSFIITDSTGKDYIRKPTTVNLESYKDTVFNLIFYEKVYEKNTKLIDLENFNPYRNLISKKYSVYFRSVSPTPSEIGRFQASKKIEFIRLSNETEVNPFGSNVLPVIMDINAYSILGKQPILNAHFYGNADFQDNSSLTYSLQTSFVNPFLTTNSYYNSTYYVGYFHEKFNIQFGNIYSGLPGGSSVVRGGKGIKGDYYINKYNTIGLFYVQGPRLFESPDQITAGLSYTFNNKKIYLNALGGQSRRFDNNTISNVGTINTRFSFIRNHSFGFRVGASQNTTSDTAISTYGYFGGFNYGGIFLKNRINTSISTLYYSPDFGGNGTERYMGNFSLNYNQKNKWRISLRSIYFQYKQSRFDSIFNYRLNNTLSFVNSTNKVVNLSPVLFYDISSIMNFVVHSRGIGINVSNYDITKFSKYYFNLKAGYNRAIDLETKDRFFLQTGGFIQYRVWSLTVRYNLGNLSLSRNTYIQNSNKNPQNINVSVRNQWEMPFKGFVMQNQVSYNYSTQSGNSANFLPELYYYSKGGWRFRIYGEWSLFKRGKPDALYFLEADPETDIAKPVWNGSFNLGFGIRKEFGIPIPFVKDDYCSIECVAFYDINGNGKQDKDEQVLDNIVVKINGFEAITSQNGKCQFKNIAKGIYQWSSFSLEYINGWFPYLEDSVSIYKNGTVYVPFTRGVKVSGKVFVDREKWSAFADLELDLSKIKITAVNHKVYNTYTDKNADFSFYLPKGKYVISMDEKVLGGRFQLLQNNFEFEVDESFDNLFVPFYIVEKKRKVKIKKF